MSESEELSRIRLRMSRRIFLARAGKGALALAAVSVLEACAPGGFGARSRKPEESLFSADQRETLEAVQEHMLPSSGESPGAARVHAFRYLDAALRGQDVEPSDTERICDGADSLRSRSISELGRPFHLLDAEEKESMLRAMEDGGDGEIFLTLVMGYLIEAWVGDPAHGGNPDGIAWSWLEHKAGWPRPAVIGPEDRR